MASRQASQPVDEWKDVQPDDGWKDVDLTSNHGPTGVGVLDTLGSIGGGLADAAGNTLSALAHPIDTAKGILASHGEQFSKAKQAAQSGDYLGAASHGAAGLIPVAGPFLHNAMDRTEAALNAHDPQAAIRETAGAIAPLALPSAVRGLGKSMAAAAPPLAEHSLGIRGVSHAFGATPGKAILEETRGVRPETVRDSAQQRLGDLNQELEAKALMAPGTASLRPARDIILQREATAARGNSAQTPKELQPMIEHLTVPQNGFGGAVDPSGFIEEQQHPSDFLQLKREFGKDFTRWNPLNPSGEMGTARKAYGALANEFNQAVPGAEPLNQRISSLIPVSERANIVQHNATLPQRVQGRLAAHTGALAGTAVGYATHGLPGAVMGMVIPEFLSDPTVQMVGARSLNAAGKGLENPVPGNAARVLSMTQRKENQ